MHLWFIRRPRSFSVVVGGSSITILPHLVQITWTFAIVTIFVQCVLVNTLQYHDTVDFVQYSETEDPHMRPISRRKSVPKTINDHVFQNLALLDLKKHFVSRKSTGPSGVCLREVGPFSTGQRSTQCAGCAAPSAQAQAKPNNARAHKHETSILRTGVRPGDNLGQGLVIPSLYSTHLTRFNMYK